MSALDIFNRCHLHGVLSRRVGVIGGGQLGMMLTEAARNLKDDISGVTVLDPVADCPAKQVGAEQIVGGFRSNDAITKLASCSDVITYEIESGDSDALAALDAEIHPSPETLRTIQDKLLQKQFLRGNGVPVADFAEVSSWSDLDDLVRNFGYPYMLKARRDGYDGRGNAYVDSHDSARSAFSRFGDAPLMLERIVDFVMEVSVVAARSTTGEIAAYPLVENIHKDGILRMTVAPARITDDVARKARSVALHIMDLFGDSGVFGIEMFVTNDHDILVNEIAPRVHNSGHHTLQSSDTSQFEQHLRAVLGLKLGSTRLRRPTIMCNLLGPEGYAGEYAVSKHSEPDVHLKMYGKRGSKPKRKLGHFNVTGDGDTTMEQLFKRACSLSESIRIIPV